MAVPPTKTPRTCSQCGNNGHNARTCSEHSTTTTIDPPKNGFMLFGVRLTAIDGCSSSSSSPTLSNSPSSVFRKSMSMNNLSQYEQSNQLPNDSSSNGFASNDVVSPTGYASDDAVHASASRSRERKRGSPWTEDEHRLFLMGLNKVGKGDWRGISRNFVKTRTPTQVASHAQKYFLRRNNINRRRRRSSLFDITTDAVKLSSSDEKQLLGQDSKPQLKTSATFATPYPPTLRPISTKNNRSIPILPVPPSTKMASLNLNQSPTMSSTSTFNNTKEREYEPFLALKLSQEPSDNEESSRRSPTFGGFKGNGDNIISVA
ncbi:Transcription factor KUA1 [Bienertia sinuspersici]